MRALIAFLLLLVCAAPASAQFSAFVAGPASGGGGGGGTAFTALHTYFMAASGCSDGNAGTSSGSPWCTPNHAVVCGDVIVAASGTYNGDFSTWGAVSNCPSTTGGIDGAGGVYAAVLLCAGNLQTCNINCATAACNAGTTGSGGRSGVSAAMNLSSDNWAVEGWAANGNGNSHRGFQVSACLTTTTILHHIAFINDIAYNAADGFDADECGYNTNVPGNGIDEWAVVGSIAQNANSDSICLAAIDDVATANFDSTAGTHVFINGNFVIANNNNPNCTNSDGEAIMLDTLDAHGYSKQLVVSDNVAYNSSWVGLQVFQQSYNSSAPTIYIENNTFFNNEVCTYFLSGNAGEINLQINGDFPWTIITQNNITRTNRRLIPTGSGCGTGTYQAFAMMASAGSAVTITTGGSGNQNVFFGEATSCPSTCDSGDNVLAYNSAGIGTNTYEDPLFTNTADLLANWIGAPSGSSYTNVAAYMGWNNASQTVTTLTPVSDLAATASGTSGKGYQTPAACAANALYPMWLKGIVFLQWSGTALTENAGLVNKPCGV
jgi:hypothetical protein